MAGILSFIYAWLIGKMNRSCFDWLSTNGKFNSIGGLGAHPAEAA
ncbi:MAG: hypothetical protein NTX45_19620 [Proteobacteria bacterium]|nr:hypothetical protein [Pseudomonadota bacterium]